MQNSQIQPNYSGYHTKKVGFTGHTQAELDALSAKDFTPIQLRQPLKSLTLNEVYPIGKEMVPVPTKIYKTGAQWRITLPVQIVDMFNINNMYTAGFDYYVATNKLIMELIPPETHFTNNDYAVTRSVCTGSNGSLVLNLPQKLIKRWYQGVPNQVSFIRYSDRTNILQIELQLY